MSKSTNPLAKHFRQPAIYLKLPSGGKWWPKEALDLPPTGEIAILPMSARDELTLKTPDALLNGQATVNVFESCCPEIKNAWAMPAVDIDAVLIAIRQASYGTAMEFFSLCPHCGTRNEHVVDISVLGAQITCPDYDKTLTVDNLTFYFRPQTYEQFNKTGIESYDQQRVIEVVGDTTLDEKDKLDKFAELFSKLLEKSIELVSSSVSAIKMSDGTVVDNREQIIEYFMNCPKKVSDQIEAHLKSLGEHNPLKNVDVKCDNEECLKEYKTPLIFEQSTFFG